MDDMTMRLQLNQAKTEEVLFIPYSTTIESGKYTKVKVKPHQKNEKNK